MDCLNQVVHFVLISSEKYIVGSHIYGVKKYIVAYHLVWLGEVPSYLTFSSLMILFSKFISIFFRLDEVTGDHPFVVVLWLCNVL